MKRNIANRNLCFLMTAAGVFLVSSCQSGGGVAHVQYPDAVVNLNQVDPRYRPYFRAQHGANYGIEEQRNAFYAAQKTARTPVTAGGYEQPLRRGANKSTIIRKTKSTKRATAKKSVSRGRVSGRSSRSVTTSRKKATVRKKTSPRRKR